MIEGGDGTVHIIIVVAVRSAEDANELKTESTQSNNGLGYWVRTETWNGWVTESTFKKRMEFPIWGASTPSKNSDLMNVSIGYLKENDLKEATLDGESYSSIFLAGRSGQWKRVGQVGLSY